jgi:hypothetical protein
MLPSSGTQRRWSESCTRMRDTQGQALESAWVGCGNSQLLAIRDHCSRDFVVFDQSECAPIQLPEALDQPNSA